MLLWYMEWYILQESSAVEEKKCFFLIHVLRNVSWEIKYFKVAYFAHVPVFCPYLNA